MTKSDYAITATGVHKSFGKLEVLKGIDLRVRRGTILALLGPNGAGKTTTIRILSTLLKAEAGQAKVEGYDVATESEKVRSVIGLTGQYAAVDEFLTGRENLHLIGRLYHVPRSQLASRAEELLKQFDLVEAANRAAKTYSGGMRRRLDLAASLIAEPAVLFLDEPTSGLDPRSRLAMWDIIKGLTARGTTILLTTQYLEEADLLADRIAVIDGGKVIAEGTANELKERVGKERIELMFASQTSLTKAQELVGGEIAQDSQLTLSLVNDGGVAHLRTVLEKLDRAKIKVEGLSLHKPTLDDVFLKLTGHGAGGDSDEKDKK